MGFANRTVKQLAFLAFCVSLFVLAAAAQSTDQSFPTPLTTNEIEGTIKARDLGDPRATTYFYSFDGAQGDIFINVVAKNFTGDIDVFTVEGMTPLTKVVIYADADGSETGRLIYLRKPEQLLLRIQGRTPNDDPATFRIKFGGSFIALAPQKQEAEPMVAVTDPNSPGVKVNSAGRIVAVVPKARPSPKAEEPKPEPTPSSASQAGEETPTAKVTEPSPPKATPKRVASEPATVFRNKSAKVTVAPPPKREQKPPPRRTATSNPPARTAKPPAKAEPDVSKNERPPANASTPEKTAEALASIRLVIQMKDGTTFWFPMNEVLKFTVDKGVMTVIAKNGNITRYNILDVEKTTIQ